VNKVVLNWLRPLWEGDQEIEKRPGRNELMWVSVHMCMEAKLGIFLYFYLKLLKTLCLFYYLSCFLFNKIREQEYGTGSAWKLGGRLKGRRGHKQCIHM
jgi:hypothetical protein